MVRQVFKIVSLGVIFLWLAWGVVNVWRGIEGNPYGAVGFWLGMIGLGLGSLAAFQWWRKLKRSP